ncbi:hypothetical protein HS088_TW20G00439 [Tripterygium wilfordii]|uniref:Protein kinase domain-containing protein n=2 Tax=Tripterygium wilfordii TaxID=458696 RepID=A0A7J7C7G2_TRIWF|nr:hypothetical protein HS088_TW20G00439 [Tripterygium wilfordii]
MLTRAFTKPRKSNTKDGDQNGSRSGSLNEYYDDDFIVGVMDDRPLIFCGENIGGSKLSLKEVLRASVGVMGESRLGMTEKVVLLNAKVYAVKRFKKASVGRSEFGRRVDRLAQVSSKSEYLVPITAYLYSKRIKIVVSDYYPMGSLADLLSGGREHDHTALDWNQRLMIALDIAKAIAFIHTQSPRRGKNMHMNVHGDIKSSNVMINIDFTARLLGYGFTQIAERIEVSDTWQHEPPPLTTNDSLYCENLCQKCDIYNFGILLMDMLGGSGDDDFQNWTQEKKQDIKDGDVEFFEFIMEGKERKQALMVLDIALACINKSADDRPSIEQILLFLEDVLIEKQFPLDL